MKSFELREKFFSFFNKRGHTTVPSSSLVPAQDPTLLFTNAGMNQFKDVFLGKEKRSYTRAVSIQKCMRAGGKHNDLDNVGFTARHLTFFEMMGNFSFGDYFKKEAIQFAWEFLTKDAHLNPDHLYVSVFLKDDEAFDIWHTVIGLPKERIVRLGEKDNFWQMGDTGPCGPCSEIYIDRGAQFSCGRKTCAPGCDCERFLEVWNLVFIQYDRQSDGTDIPLKHPGVDTGMGLERLSMIVENKNSIFETDLFQPIIEKISSLTGHNYATAKPEIKSAFNVLADHMRATSFLIADGITPSNEGRGYVLRKIIRRAALFEQKLSKKSILSALVEPIVEKMNAIYPELKVNQSAIEHIINIEAEKFASSLIHGQHVLNQFIQEAEKTKIVSGEHAFKLYDTYGFPLELTRVIAHEHGFEVDTDAFDALMEKQRELSGGKLGKKEKITIALPETIKTEFTGYQELETTGIIKALIVDSQLVPSIHEGATCWIITDRSPFYVEKGGQVSDQGWIRIGTTQVPVQMLKRIDNAIAVKITSPDELKVGQQVISIVDKQYRQDVMNNHTATHLLQAALIELLGKEVKQSGSLVHPDYLRFDFTYHKALTPEQIKTVEERVNEKIRENIPLNIFYTSYKDALEKGVIAIFGEKYDPEEVRVIDIPRFSKELCGGTHVNATGDIGCFKITEEIALSTGQRRIVALTGRKAIELFQLTFDNTKKLSQEFKTQQDQIITAVEKQREQLKLAQNTIKKLKKELWKKMLPEWIASLKQEKQIFWTIINVEDANIQDLKEIVELLQQQKAAFYGAMSKKNENEMIFYAQVHPQFEEHINMQLLAKNLAEAGLKSGGKKGTLQGGGTFINKDQLKKIIQQSLI